MACEDVVDAPSPSSTMAPALLRILLLALIGGATFAVYALVAIWGLGAEITFTPIAAASTIGAFFGGASGMLFGSRRDA